MSTLNDVLTSLRTQLNSQLSLSNQFASDYVPDLEQMSSLNTSQAQNMFRIRQQHEEEQEGSNVAYEAAAIEVEVSHRLTDPFNERTYTEGAMHTQQKLLVSRDFWRSLTGVFEVLEGPVTQIDVERVGNVIRWSVLVKILIVPS